MSRLTELQRKAALIRAYLLRNNAYPSNSKQRITKLGITRATLENWIKGDVITPNRIPDIEKQMREAFHLSEDTPHLLNRLGVMELGKLLGLTRLECQMAIDQVAGELGPTFSSFLMDRVEARSMLSLFQGLYVVYRYERTAEVRRAMGKDEYVMCMALSVRYSLTSAKTLSNGSHRVRCKLNIPSYRLIIEHHEYDGYLTPADGSGRHYWMFEIRAQFEQDVVFMMTDGLRRGPRHAPERQFALGVMISRTQDAPSVPAIWPIVIERRGELDAAADEDFDDSTEKRFMREHAKLQEPENIDDWVKSALREAEQFATFYRGG